MRVLEGRGVGVGLQPRPPILPSSHKQEAGDSTQTSGGAKDEILMATK